MNELPSFALSGLAAKNLEDVRSLHVDLCFVNEALIRLWKLQSDNSEDRVVAMSLWTSAVIAYCPCFAHGKRFGLTTAVYDGLEGATEFHEYIKHQRDKHIAHSVNPFEQAKVGVSLSDDTESADVVAVVSMSVKFQTPEISGIRDFGRLVERAIKHVNERGKQAEQELFEFAKSKSIAEIRKCPAMGVFAPGPDLAGVPRG